MRQSDGPVHIGGVFDEEGMGRGIAHGRLHVVAHAAFESHIGDQTVHVFRIDARRIAGVRVAVGVAVLAVEHEQEFVAVGDDAHGVVLLHSGWVDSVGLPALKAASCW